MTGSNRMLKYLVILFAFATPVNAQVRIEGPLDTLAIFTSLELSAFRGQESVDVFIDSPGGLVDAGNMLISVIERLKSEGTQVHCYAKTAYSMAFQVFLHCSERFLYEDSTVMFHYAALAFEPNKFFKYHVLVQIVNDMAKVRQQWLEEWRTYLKLPDSQLNGYAERDHVFNAPEFIRLTGDFARLIPGPAPTPSN